LKSCTPVFKFVIPKDQNLKGLPIQNQKDPKMAITSEKRGPNTLNTNKTKRLMQMHAFKKSGKGLLN
jgi:hypothetical protein